jgi:hypothetical protein
MAEAVFACAHQMQLLRGSGCGLLAEAARNKIIQSQRRRGGGGRIQERRRITRIIAIAHSSFKERFCPEILRRVTGRTCAVLNGPFHTTILRLSTRTCHGQSAGWMISRPSVVLMYGFRTIRTLFRRPHFNE